MKQPLTEEQWRKLEESVKNPYGFYPTLDERDQIKRKHRKRIVEHEIEVQTYCAYITLECGHRTSYTMSARRFRTEPRDKWKTRRKSCFRCADAEIEALKLARKEAAQPA
jgi:hypothetical protein